jgi:hypothetical protein
VVQRSIDQQKLGTPIDSELLIYCLQADYILSHIWVCVLKTPFYLEFTPLLLSTMHTTSPLLVALLCTVVATAHLLVVLLCSVVAAPQPLGGLCMCLFPQLFTNQLSSPQCGVDQLLSELGSHSKLRLPLTFRLPTPLVSVPVSVICCSVVSVMSHSGTCLVPV